jgi:hypothetical protein
MHSKVTAAIGAALMVGATVGGLELGAGVARAATPSHGTVTAPGQGTARLGYKGTVPPGTGSLVKCQQGINADVFTLTVRGIGPGFYRTHKALLVAHIEWDPRVGSPSGGGSDVALLVTKDGSEVGSSDGGTAEETVPVDQPTNGKYKIYACAFSVAVPQPYEGTVTLSTGHQQRLPRAARSRGLRFMPLTVADPQRDLGEPSIRVDKKGIVYHCAPFGSSRNADYMSRSTDHGNTFMILGTPPEGRIAPGGGGDCEISVAPKKNARGNYTLSYVGLEALTNFSTGRSLDKGRSFQGTNTSETVPVVDRQWIETNGSSEVYLFYNEIPQGGTAQRSTDGGLTYAPPSNLGNATHDIGRPGNIVIDRNPKRNPAHNGNETVYVTYTNGNKVEVARSTNQAQTFKRFVVAKGKGAPDNLFPTIAIDTKGHLYVAWAESGSYNVYYSFSRDHGVTWSRKQLVNRAGAATNLMPWIAAGSPGRVAVSFYCTSVDGNPQTGKFHGPWYVCVNQTLNGLSRNARFSQVHVSHHTIHWDSICTLGLGCDVSVPRGDRSLLDFFQTRVDPRDGRLFVIFTESNKRARRPAGLLAIDVVAKQKGGPSMFARVGRVHRDPRRIVRNGAHDRRGDARFPISSFGAPPPSKYLPGADLRSVALSPTTLPHVKHALKIRVKVRNLSDQALGQALAQMASVQLKFVVRWFSAYRPDFVVADWRPGQGFSFRRGHMFRQRTSDGRLEIYTGDQTTPGRVNRKKGIITMFVPYRFIQDYDLAKDKTAKPSLGPARPGDKIYEVTAWSFGRPNFQSGSLDFYNMADATPSFDCRLR